MHAADPGWCRLLDHLAVPGPAGVDDLLSNCGLGGKS
jgi:hypothetical protein